jgi:phosphoglycolate phosphatase
VTYRRTLDWSNKRLVLFDLDGVLLDSRENMRLSWQRACEQYGIAVGFEKYFSEIGRPFSAIMDRLGLAEQAAELEAAFRVASMENIGVVRFYPEVVETLARLEAAKVKLGIVTSKDRLRTSAILAMLPVDFSCVETPDARIRGKPAPDHLLMAMARTNVDPIDTVYVGDMDADHEAAVRARVDYAHAAWGYGRPPRDSAILAEIGDLLKSVQGGNRHGLEAQ